MVSSGAFYTYFYVSCSEEYANIQTWQLHRPSYRFQKITSPFVVYSLTNHRQSWKIWRFRIIKSEIFYFVKKSHFLCRVCCSGSFFGIKLNKFSSVSRGKRSIKTKYPLATLSKPMGATISGIFLETFSEKAIIVEQLSGKWAFFLKQIL